MQYDFDRWPDRLNTNSVKWDELPFKNVKEGFIPLWVADMDFPVAPEIIGAMKERLDHPYFGYFSLTDENFYRPIIEWQKARYGVEGLEPGQILYENGVLAGIAHLLQALSSPGDPVVLQTPGYPGFEGVLNTMNRKIIPNPMIDNGGYFTIDYRDLEKKIVDSGAKILLFCSPQNPTGRVWTAEEQRGVVDICLKHGVTIIADQIWSDIILTQDAPFVPLSSADERAKEISVEFFSPSKGFSMAAMYASYAVCRNPVLCEKLRAASNYLHCNNPALLSVVGLAAAYTKGEEWLEQCRKVISGNMEYIVSFLKERLPGITTRKAEGTYLLWLNFSGTGLTHEEMIRRTVHGAGVVLNDGRSFISNGECRMRLNAAAPRAMIEQAMKRLEGVFRDTVK